MTQREIDMNNNNNITNSSDHSSSDFDEYSTDFAAQLKKHRKQVLDKDNVAASSFASSLRKHRETLVGTWEESQQQTQVSSSNNSRNSTSSTSAATATMNGDGLNGDHVSQMNGDGESIQQENGSEDVFSAFDILTTPDPDLTTETPPLDDKALEATPNQTEKSVISDDDDDDDDDDNFFGDFEATLQRTAGPESLASEPAETPVPAITPMSSTDDDDDLFRAFDSIPPTTDDTTNKVEVAEVLTDSKADESSSGPVEDSATIELSPVVADEAPETDVDVQSASDPVSDPPIDPSQLDETYYHTQPTSDNDFVGFDDAPRPTPISQDATIPDVGASGDVAPTPISEEAMEPNDVVKDCGSFDDVAPPTPVSPNETAPIDTVQDFGGFGDVAPAQDAAEQIDAVQESQIISEQDDSMIPVESLADSADPYTSNDEPIKAIQTNGEGIIADAATMDATNGVDDYGWKVPLSAEMTIDETDATNTFGDIGGGSALPQKAEDPDDNHEGIDDMPVTSEQQDNDQKTSTEVPAQSEDEVRVSDGAIPEPFPEQENILESTSEAPLSQSFEAGDKDDDEFGDFDTTASQGELNVGNVEENDDFGVFETPLTQSEPSGDQSEDLSNENAAEGSAEQLDDEFGDFDGFDGAAEGASIEATDAVPETPEEDFSAFDGPATQPVDDDDIGVLDNSPQQTEDHDAAAEEVDNFGAFDGPSPLSDPVGHEVTDDDDDFGDFGGASDKLQEEEEPSGEMDDDFGAFDGPSTQTRSADRMPNDPDDDFGDFGDFDSATPAATSDKELGIEDDDFGDFGTPVAPAPTIEETRGAEEEEDDFGDFDTATSNPPDTSNDMDDFGRFDELAIESITPLAPIGEIGDKARTFFVSMQSKYSFPEKTEDDVEPETIEGSISTITESLTANMKTTSVCFSREGLFDALQALPEKEEKSMLIIDGDGRSPSEPFAYPVGGLHAPDEQNHEMERLRRSSIASLKVPDVLPIQLPTGTDDTPLDTASPVARKRTFSASRLDAPAIPKLLHAEPSSEGATSADTISSLLSRIPDLSFMLQSKLVLPK